MSERLHPLDLEAIVDGLAARLLEEGGERTGLVDVKAAAAYLGVSDDWIYTHQEELGVFKIGDGPAAPTRPSP